MKIPSGAKSQNTYLCHRIRTVRLNAKLTQASLAQQLGVTSSAVAQWEHPAGTRPSIEHLDEIARATRSAFEWLATGRGNNKRHFNQAREDETPAVTLSSFAQSVEEELLLERFRALSSIARDALNKFLNAVVSASRRR